MFVSPCLWSGRCEFQLLTWASAGSAEVWTFSYCFTFTSWRWGTSCREEQEADVPPNLIWFDGRFSFLTRSTSPGYPLTLIAQSSLCVIHSARWWYPKSGYLGSCQYVHFPSSSNGEVLFLWCEMKTDVAVDRTGWRPEAVLQKVISCSLLDEYGYERIPSFLTSLCWKF